MVDVGKLKGEIDGKSWDAAATTLASLKVQVAQTPVQERMTAAALAQERELYECAVLLSVQTQNTMDFERHMALLTPYYTDFGAMLPPSENHHPILGLNCLRLLAQNRIADFHVQLETMSPEALESAFVQFPVQLERSMMEGSYTKVLEMRENLPLPSYGVFMDMLKDTLRDEVATVSEKAYKSIPVPYCMQLLMMSSQGELDEYAATREWVLRDGRVFFEADTAEKKEVPAIALISETLHYAKELERIV